METLETYLPLSFAHLSQDFVSESNRRVLSNVAARLPIALTDCYGFERRLGEAGACADFFICVGIQNRGRAALAGEAFRACIAQRGESTAWEPVFRLADAWGSSSSALFSTLDNFWLEFDVDSPSPAFPSLFFGAQSHALSRPSLSWEVIRLSWAAALPVPSIYYRTMEMCLSHLPENAEVFQTGCMLAREPMRLRLCVWGLRLAEILSYLPAIGWEGDETALESLLEELAAQRVGVALNLEVGEGVSPRLGLECYLPEFKRFCLTPQTVAFLGWLEAKSLCLPMLRRGVEEWVGLEEAGGVAPAPLRGLQNLLGGSARFVAGRRLNHVKLTLSLNEPLQAKAYLAMEHRWVSL